jgi:hypothetical protein
MNDVEHDVTAHCRGHADLYRTGQHAHEPGVNITLGEDDPAPRYPALLHVGGKTLDCRRTKRTKYRVVAEKRKLVDSSTR